MRQLSDIEKLKKRFQVKHKKTPCKAKIQHSITTVS